MLKITAWIDSLPKLAKKRHRNAAENSSKRKSSRRTATKPIPTGIERDSNWAYEPMLVKNSCQYPMKPIEHCFVELEPPSCAQSASLPHQNRPNIRTNPWVKPKPPMTLGWNSVDISNKQEASSPKLEESTCSSGYGSQDSSPESSVHSPDWSFTLSAESPLDKAVTCCFTKEIGVGCDEDAIDRDFQLQSPPAPADILTELSQKLDELRRKRQLVDQAVALARVERNRRLKERQICQEQLHRIRQMRWVVHGSDIEI